MRYLLDVNFLLACVWRSHAQHSRASAWLDRQAVFDALANIVVPPVIEQQSQMQDIVTKALESAQTGQASVQDALNNAADQVNALLK